MAKSGIYGISNVVPVTLCPNCGKAHDRAGHHADSVKPKPGDVGVCNWCLTVNVYNEHLQLRSPTTEEKAEIDADPEVRAARRYLVEMKARGWPIAPPKRGAQF